MKVPGIQERERGREGEGDAIFGKRGLSREMQRRSRMRVRDWYQGSDGEEIWRDERRNARSAVGSLCDCETARARYLFDEYYTINN
jgi:hypothetical protein